jgi:hypothetical protein
MYKPVPVGLKEFAGTRVTIVVPVVADDTELLMLKLPVLPFGITLFQLANPPVTGFFHVKCFPRLFLDNLEEFVDTLMVRIPPFKIVLTGVDHCNPSPVILP